VSGPLAEALASEGGRADLLGLLSDRLGDVPLVHELAVSPHRFWPAMQDPFAAEFAAALTANEAALRDPSARVGLLSLPADAPYRERLGRLLAVADAAAVIGEARRIGGLIAAAANSPDDED
jgi:hypothetical protein